MKRTESAADKDALQERLTSPLSWHRVLVAPAVD